MLPFSAILRGAVLLRGFFPFWIWLIQHLPHCNYIMAKRLCSFQGFVEGKRPNCSLGDEFSPLSLSLLKYRGAKRVFLPRQLVANRLGMAALQKHCEHDLSFGSLWRPSHQTGVGNFLSPQNPVLFLCRFNCPLSPFFELIGVFCKGNFLFSIFLPFKN